MNLNKPLSLSFVSLLAALSILPAPITYAHEAPSTLDRPTSETIPAPHHSYSMLYTLHANSATLQKSKDKCQLTLDGVNPIINYQAENSTESTGSTIKLQDLLTSWQAKASNKPVEADVTGVQVDNKTIGHTQFYATMLLDLPYYDAASHTLIFPVEFIYPQPADIPANKPIVMDTATLFINGKPFK